MSTVVITGGSRGIGAAAVELFAARGDRVVFLYEKNHEAAAAVAEKTGAEARPQIFAISGRCLWFWFNPYCRGESSAVSRPSLS